MLDITRSVMYFITSAAASSTTENQTLLFLGSVTVISKLNNSSSKCVNPSSYSTFLIKSMYARRELVVVIEAVAFISPT